MIELKQIEMRFNHVVLSQESLHVQYEYLMLVITRTAWDRQVQLKVALHGKSQ